MIALISTLALSLTATLAPAAQDDAVEVPPIQDLGDTYLLSFSENNDGLTLERWVKLCQQTTGINFTYSNDTMGNLSSKTVRMYGPKEIPKEDFYSFFQIIMIINDYVCTRIGPDHLAVVVVQDLNAGQTRSTIRQDATYVEPDEIDVYATQPATIIQTVIHLPNTDTRTMSNQLRGMGVDQSTMAVIPVSTNHVILQGFGNQIASLVKMLQLIDEYSAPEDPIHAEIEVLPLEFSSAEEIAETLSELLDASRRAAQTVGRQQQQAQGATGALQQQTAETKVMVNPSSNSLLIVAMPDEMPRIKELVARLDVEVQVPDKTYHIYNLDNADAKEMADVLESFLQDASRIQQGQTAQGGRQGGGAQSNSSEVVVVPDPATNSLLIAATRSRWDEVLDMILRLDQRQPQVLIETALIELTGSDFLSLGVELGLADIPGVDQVGGFGVSSFGISSFQDTDLDGIPDTRIPNVTNGITAGILDGENFSLPILIQALEQDLNSNVLNIPSILVNNNGGAKVETKDEQPTTQITASGASVSGFTQESFRDYEEAGITLSISPTISASRYLRLNISLEVSTFLGSFNGPIPPPRLSRLVQTTVNVPDGSTMVIGGILVDNLRESSDKIPFLGDLPIIGSLFSAKEETKQRTSLYFFVTPHIMRDVEFADLAEYSYQKKLEAADSIGSDRIRLIDEKFGQETVIPGFEVPLFQSPGSGELDATEVGITPEEIAPMIESAKKDAVTPSVHPEPQAAAEIDEGDSSTKEQEPEPTQDETAPAKAEVEEEEDGSWVPGTKAKRS
jgi:general secretion pathway protein D